MSGIIADMTIINILLRNYFPKLIPFLDNKKDNYGDYIGNNFINTNLINLFTNDHFDKDTSLLIWDLLFIDGNMVLIKAFLALYDYLLPLIIDSETTIEEFQKIIKKNLKEIKCDNKDLIFYLIIKDYNFSKDEIDQARFSLTINLAKSLQKEKEKNINIRKKSLDGQEEKIECKLDWPVCIYDKYFSKNDAKFFIIFQRKKKIFLKNYFFDKFKMDNLNSHNKKSKNENDDKDLLIERKTHYCFGNNDLNKVKVKDKIDEKIDEKEININNEEKYNNYDEIINKPEFIEASKNVINDLKIKLKNKENDENK